MTSIESKAKNKNPIIVVMDFITDGMAVISGILIGVITIMVCTAVLLRYGFRLSVGWSTEIVEYFVYAAVMLGTPWVLKKDKHVRVDVFVGLMKPKYQKIAEIMVNVIGILATIGFGWYGFLAVQENFIKGTMMVKVLPVPKYVPLLLIPIMSVPLLYQFIRKLVATINLKVD